MSSKRALIIANTEYTDPGFSQLRAPGKDAEAFAQVLRSPDGCAFDEVNVLLNKLEFEIREAIDEFFDSKKPDDLLLLYFSGHGIRDDVGALYLAVRNTNRSRLRATALKSDFIRESMDGSRSRRQVLILDCCYSGAFAEGTKAAAGGSVGTASAFEGTGYGRIVLTASDATQFAWEGDKVIGETENSLFTHFLIKGLEGEADKNKDGEITVDDLYEYAYEKVITITPRQRPGKWSYKQQGDLTLRELSEAEKERRLTEQLEEQARATRRGQEEAARLALIEAERQREFQSMKAAREAAEQAAREAAEKALQETARREALEREMARRRSEQEQLGIAAPAHATLLDPAPPSQPTRQPTRKRLQPAYLVALFGVLGAVVVFLGARALLLSPAGLLSGNPSTQPSSVTPASDGEASVALPGVVPTPIFSLPNDSALPIDSMAVISPENVSEIRGIARWGGYIVNNMAVSPDGDLVAVASSIGVHIYDAHSLEDIRFLETGDSVNCVVFSPDGKQIVSGSNRDKIRVWNVGNGELMKTLANYYSGSSDVMGLLYLEDDFLVVGYEGGIALFDLKKSSFVGEANWYGSGLSSLALSRDGKTMASLSYGEVLFWTLDPAGENPFTLSRRIEHDKRYGQQGIQFSSDGQLVLVSSEYNGSKIWRINDGIATTSLDTEVAAFSPAENVIAVAFSEDGLQLDYPGTSKARTILDAGATEVKHLLFHPDGNMLFVVADNVLQNWNTAAGSLVASKQLFVHAPTDFAIPADTGLIAAATTYADNHIRLHKYPSNEMIREITTSDDRIDNIAISADGSILISTNDTIVQLWDPATGQLIRSMTVGDDGYIDSIAISSDNKMLAYSLDAYSAVSLEVVNIEDGSKWTIVDSATTDPYYYPLEFSPDGAFLAGASEHLEIWDVQSGAQRQTTEETSTFTFLPDGIHFAYAADKIYVASVADGTLVKAFQLPESRVGSIALSPDGALLAASTSDGFVYFWKYEDAALLTGVKVSSQRYGAPFVTFSSDGRFLITSSREGYLAFWGIQEEE